MADVISAKESFQRVKEEIMDHLDSDVNPLVELRDDEEFVIKNYRLIKK